MRTTGPSPEFTKMMEPIAAKLRDDCLKAFEKVDQAFQWPPKHEDRRELSMGRLAIKVFNARERQKRREQRELKARCRVLLAESIHTFSNQTWFFNDGVFRSLDSWDVK